MHRQPEHVMTFLLAEMGTSGSLDGQQRLVVKGRFAPKNFEGIVRRYISKYIYGLFGLKEEGGGVKGNRVEWAKNRLILSQFHSTLFYSTPPPSSSIQTDHYSSFVIHLLLTLVHPLIS